MDASLTATLRNAETSHKKIAVPAKAIRGKDALYAVDLLRFMPKKSAKILHKVLHSAIKNAENNGSYTADNLIVDRVDIGQAQKLKRMRFVSRGRAHRYIKHRANIRVVLGVK
jgi:large subunit ribosomal protein L22